MKNGLVEMWSKMFNPDAIDGDQEEEKNYG